MASRVDNRTLTLLRGAQLRATPQREAVLAVLVNDGVHLTAASVHDRVLASGLRTTLSTVHRTLVGLTDAGLLHSVTTRHGTAFGLHHGVEHGHATCTRCGTTVDIDVASAVIEPALGEAGFKPSGALVIDGLCHECPR